MNKSPQGQTQRIYDALVSKAGQEIPMPELVKIGAGPNGKFISSFTRRISECRERLAVLGMCIPAPRIERVKETGQIHTFYKCVPMDDTQPA